MASTLDAAPQTHTAWGAASNAETSRPMTPFREQLLDRVTRPDFDAWQHHITAAGGCTRPVRLAGGIHTVTSTGGAATIVESTQTATMPDGVIYKACGNRRAAICPSCAQVYQRDAYQLLRAGLVGGKGIPTAVATHPAAFVTFTAPSFGPVHGRVVNKHTCADRRRCDCRPARCQPRRKKTCVHGQPAACFARHEPDDKRLGKPLCLDCYDHDHQVVFNLSAGELWRRTRQAVDRHLSKLARQRGIPRVLVGFTPDGKPRTTSPVRIAYAKVGEFQIRGAIHFHAIIRLDGVDPETFAATVPPDSFGVEDLDDAVRTAVAQIGFDTPPHPDRPAGWPIAWGTQVDPRPINLGDGEVTDSMVAGYLAKYATKAAEITGHRSTRITDDAVDQYADHEGDHIARLIAACWHLGRPTHTPVPLSKRPRPTRAATRPQPCQTHSAVVPAPGEDCVDCAAYRQALVVDQTANEPPPNPYAGLRRWAHMLGFAGHFLTKGRRYSVTFTALRDLRTAFRRAHHQETGPVDLADEHGEETTLVVGSFAFTGAGWHNAADAYLANSAAARAREYAATAREEIAHLNWTQAKEPQS